MLFKFKKKKVVLNCYTSNPVLHDLFKIQKATNFYPDFWKELDKEIYEESEIAPVSTLKRCSGFIDYYKNGYILPLWSDFILKVNPDGNYFWEFADKANRGIIHRYAQRKGFLENYGHIKIINPWFLSCDEDIKWSCTFPSWNNQNIIDFIVPPTVLEFKYQNSLNCNLFFPIGEKSKTYQISANQPIIHLLPLTDKEIVVQNHLVSDSEIIKLEKYKAPFSFTNWHSKRKNLTKKGCPFHV
jgi:hypothetical protein